MEKLIELLNEYEPYIASDGEHRDNLWGYAYQWHSAVFPKEIAESYIISARYGFIKWLVENDKIDRWELDYKNIYMSDYWSSDDIFLAYNKWEQWIIYTVDYYETILMLLSISDTPIEDLISYLR